MNINNKELTRLAKGFRTTDSKFHLITKEEFNQYVIGKVMESIEQGNKNTEGIPYATVESIEQEYFE